MKNVTKDQWVEIFRAVGLTDDQMHRWHLEFEGRYPDGHQLFLEWLGIDETEIRRIREWSTGSISQ